MFVAGRVSPSRLAEIARAAQAAKLTYEGAGATLAGALPPGFRHDKYEVTLPGRTDAFERAVQGLRQWQAHQRAGLAVQPQDPPAVGATVAVATALGPVTAVAVCRIVAVVEEPDRYGFAYGTLPGHPERGEEAFIVEQRSDAAIFTIRAFSRPAEALARIGGPVTRWIQTTTTRRYLDGLASFVADTP